MKLLIPVLILSLFVLVISCKSSDSARDNNHRTYKAKTKRYKARLPRETAERDPAAIDSTEYVLASPPEPMQDDPDVPEEKVVIEEVMMGAEPEEQMALPKPKSYVMQDDEGVEHVVKDATKPDSTKGTMAYNIPDDMTVGKNYEVKVRITKDNAGKQQLVVGEEGTQPIATVGEKSTITIESIRVESVMSAELISLDQAFEINTSSTKEQNIEKLGYTEWAWNIKPIKSGEHPLKLLIKVRIVNEQGGYYKDIVVFERNIKTKANFSYSASVWFGKYWQWLCTTIVIPIFLWWRKRKKERDDKEKETT